MARNLGCRVDDRIEGPGGAGIERPRKSAALWKSALAIGLLLVAALGALPSSAGASPARYVFEMCDSALPGGGVGGAAFALMPKQPWTAADSCAQSGGALSVNLYGHSSGGASNWQLPITPPPGGSMETISLVGGACLSPGVSASILGIGWSGSCIDESRTVRLPSRFGNFGVRLGCFENCEGGSRVWARYLATTMVDPVPPSLASLSGSLVDPGVRRGRQTVSVATHDEGGGISSVSLLVNGLPASPPRVSNCDVAQTENFSVVGTVAAQIVPCPANLETHWSVDTAAYPFQTGANRVQVCASDFATLGDPNTSCSAAQRVQVDDSCVESAVPGGDELSAQFAQSNADTVTVGFGEGAKVTGELDTGAGDPVPGATLCVKEATLAVDARAEPVAVVKTDSAGRFNYEVPPGPNREVVVGYRYDDNQVARKVRYYAHTRPTLRARPTALRNGQRVRFRGSLPGPDSGGRVVILQANVAGSKRWITFRKATTGVNGGFHAGYHFTSTTRTTRYRFRALAPDQEGYPWVAGASSPVTVLVRG